MKKNLLLFFVITTLFSCSSIDDNHGTVNIRLSNVSTYNFKEITVNTSTGNVTYDDLNSGKISGYKTYELAYRYAYIELKINGTTYTLQPTDYVGETPLVNGNYTYQIDVIDAQQQNESLSLTFLKD